MAKGYYSLRIRPTDRSFSSLTAKQKELLIKKRQGQMARIAKRYSAFFLKTISVNTAINMLIEKEANK